MKVLYLDCFSGVSGDMLVGTLLALGADREAFLREMSRLGLKDQVQLSIEDVSSYGMQGVKFTVQRQKQEVHHGEHHHHAHGSLESIARAVNGSDFSQKIKDRAMSVFDVIIDAEAEVHGVSREEVHLHEVGAVDAIVDITATAVLLDMLQIDDIICAPVNLGGGTVRCAHGLMPVPAPATALLVRGRRVYGEADIGELTTPTGAALLSLARDGDMPAGLIERTGFGFGKKEIGRANCVRGLLIRTAEVEGQEKVAELAANIDDMTGEELGFAMEQLLEAGALDAWTVPITMKKSRPAVTLKVICAAADAEKMAECMFQHTTTLGIRWTEKSRFVLERKVKRVETPFGAIDVKISNRGAKPEYEQAAAAARKAGVPYKTVYNSAMAAVKDLEV